MKRLVKLNHYIKISVSFFLKKRTQSLASGLSTVYFMIYGLLFFYFSVFTASISMLIEVFNQNWINCYLLKCEDFRGTSTEAEHFGSFRKLYSKSSSLAF